MPPTSRAGISRYPWSVPGVVPGLVSFYPARYNRLMLNDEPPGYGHTVHVTPALMNHVIRRVNKPMAFSTVHDRNLPGSPETDGSWCLRDTTTGAHIRIWRESNVLPFSVAWSDGPRAPGSGQYLAWALTGTPAGGKLDPV